MTEWILLLTLNLAGVSPGDVRDVSLSTFDGFSSKQSCEVAATKIADRAIVLVGKHREREGVARGGPRQMPVINYECVQIFK